MITWNANDGALDSKLDWTQQPTTYTSTKHPSIMNDVTMECAAARITIGTSLETGGEFDIDDVQIHSEEFSAEQLEEHFLG